MHPAPLSLDALARLRTYLAQNARSPEDYITGVFKQRDVVLLGEDHAIRHNLKLVQGLIPALFQVREYADIKKRYGFASQN